MSVVAVVVIVVVAVMVVVVAAVLVHAVSKRKRLPNAEIWKYNDTRRVC